MQLRLRWPPVPYDFILYLSISSAQSVILYLYIYIICVPNVGFDFFINILRSRMPARLRLARWRNQFISKSNPLKLWIKQMTALQTMSDHSKANRLNWIRMKTQKKTNYGCTFEMKNNKNKKTMSMENCFVGFLGFHYMCSFFSVGLVVYWYI